MLKAAKAYLSTQVSTASKGDLLLMLYDTAIKHLKLAIVKIGEKDYAAKGLLITKAITIISELQESLNKEQGGDVTKNLFQVYFFCNTRLLQANLKLDTTMIEEVIGILGGLRQAFAQIIPRHEGNSTASAYSPFAEAGKTPAPEAADTPTELAAPQASAPAQDAASQKPRPEQAGRPEPVVRGEPSGQGEPAAQSKPAEPGPQTTSDPAAPVQTVRFRAASAYANSR